MNRRINKESFHEKAFDIASKFNPTVRILFVFGRIIVLIFRIRPNSKEPLFGTALVLMNRSLLAVCRVFRDALIASVLDGVRASGNRDVHVKMKFTHRGHRLGNYKGGTIK